MDGIPNCLVYLVASANNRYVILGLGTRREYSVTCAKISRVQNCCVHSITPGILDYVARAFRSSVMVNDYVFLFFFFFCLNAQMFSYGAL